MVVPPFFSMLVRAHSLRKLSESCAVSPEKLSDVVATSPAIGLAVVNNAAGGKEFKAWLAEAVRLGGTGRATTRGGGNVATSLPKRGQEVLAQALPDNDGNIGDSKIEEAADYRKDSAQTSPDQATPLKDAAPVFAHDADWADNTNDTESSEPTRPAIKDLAVTLPTTSVASVQVVSAALPGENRPVASNPSAAPAEQVAGAMLAQSATLDGDNRITLHLQLDPPGLGQVRVHVSASDHVVNARLVVQEESTRQLLESQVGLLRDQLMESGVVLGRFAVRSEGGGSGSQEQPAEHEQMPVQPRSQTRVLKKSAELPGRDPGPQGTIDVIA
jgi:flagellar hook-length control protein FliK